MDAHAFGHTCLHVAAVPAQQTNELEPLQGVLVCACVSHVSLTMRACVCARVQLCSVTREWC